MATASEDGTVKLWSLSQETELATLTADQSEVTAVAYSPDGKILVTGDANGVIRVWDVATRQIRETRREHTKAVLFAAFSRDGNHLATGGQEGAVNPDISSLDRK